MKLYAVHERDYYREPLVYITTNKEKAESYKDKKIKERIAFSKTIPTFGDKNDTESHKMQRETHLHNAKNHCYIVEYETDVDFNKE